jgi:hypothetical protein
MDENILAILATDETVTLGGIKPLDRADKSFRHATFSYKKDFVRAPSLTQANTDTGAI